MFGKKKEPTVYEMAVEEFFAACREYERVQDMFNRADESFFDIANSQLTIATLQKEICAKKVRLLQP